MQLYLIRHAQAGDAADDFSRALSPGGRRQIESLAQYFRANDLLRPEEVWHSPLLRARETAQRLGTALGWPTPFQETDILEPESDPRAVAHQLQAVARPLALVAHEPLLSALGTLLVSGSFRPNLFLIRTGDVLALEPAGPGAAGRWVEKWHIGPESLGLQG